MVLYRFSLAVHQSHKVKNIKQLLPVNINSSYHVDQSAVDGPSEQEMYGDHPLTPMRNEVLESSL